jgi:hypothetical protein
VMPKTESRNNPVKPRRIKNVLPLIKRETPGRVKRAGYIKTPLKNELRRSWIATNVIDEEFPGEVRDGVDSVAVRENEIESSGRQIAQGNALRQRSAPGRLLVCLQRPERRSGDNDGFAVIEIEITPFRWRCAHSGFRGR